MSTLNLADFAPILALCDVSKGLISKVNFTDIHIKRTGIDIQVWWNEAKISKSC